MLLKTCSAGRFSFPVGIWDLLAAGLSPVLLRALGQSNSQQPVERLHHSGQARSRLPFENFDALEDLLGGQIFFPRRDLDLLAAGLSPVLLRALGQSNSQQCASDQ